MEIAVGTVIDDRYEVLGRIGSGAVAVVYVARHLQLGSLHAVKVLMVPTRFVQQRLLQEGRLQGALRGRNVVTVTDVVDIEGAPGLVMEFVRGPSLDRLLQHLQLDEAQAVAVGAGILVGVRAAHQVGLVHRDLKPANVLVEVSDRGLLPKIADFGLAKILSGDSEGGTATREGSTLGTPAYMAPEQIRDARTVDERADVFSLGAVLYELLTGRRAFPGDDLLDLYDRIREGRYDPVRSLAPHIDPTLAAVVDHALKVDRDARISSVAELLDRWTSGRGEAAGDHDWSPTVLALVGGLTPGTSRANTTGGMSAPTFDLPPVGPPDHAPSVSPSPVPIEAVRPVRVARSRWRRRLPVLPVLGLLVGPLVCAGSLSILGAGFGAGWIQWGPEVPVPVERTRRVTYGANAWPAVSQDPLVEDQHRIAWVALRQGRPEPAREALARVVEAEGGEDLGLRLLAATGLVWEGDAEGYQRIEQAAAVAGTRRTCEADLARLAADVIRTGGDPRGVRRHFETWPEDLLGRLLLARLPGLDTEVRLELATVAIALDPQSAGGRVLTVTHLLDRGEWARADQAIDEAVQRFPGHPRLVAARARSLLLAGDAVEARRVVEEVSASAAVPELIAQHAGALRMVGDLAALDAVDRALPAETEPARRVAYARGRAEAAIGLGNIEEANTWLAEGFALASLTRRFDDALELARLQQISAVLLGRPGDLATGLDRAMAASLLGLPPVMQDRLTPRILLMQGLVALEAGDSDEVQRVVQLLGAAESGERQAAVLRAASLARQGIPTPLGDDAALGCVARSLETRWIGDSEASYAVLVGEGTRCSAFGLDRYVRADAEIRLAELAVTRGRTDLALAHVEAFTGWIPQPDLDSPLFDRLAGVQDALVVWPVGP